MHPRNGACSRSEQHLATGEFVVEADRRRLRARVGVIKSAKSQPVDGAEAHRARFATRKRSRSPTDGKCRTSPRRRGWRRLRRRPSHRWSRRPCCILPRWRRCARSRLPTARPGWSACNSTARSMARSMKSSLVRLGSRWTTLVGVVASATRPTYRRIFFRAPPYAGRSWHDGCCRKLENLVNVFQCQEHRCAVVAPLHD